MITYPFGHPHKSQTAYAFSELRFWRWYLSTIGSQTTWSQRSIRAYIRIINTVADGLSRTVFAGEEKNHYLHQQKEEMCLPSEKPKWYWKDGPEGFEEFLKQLNLPSRSEITGEGKQHGLEIHSNAITAEMTDKYSTRRQTRIGYTVISPTNLSRSSLFLHLSNLLRPSNLLQCVIHLIQRSQYFGILLQLQTLPLCIPLRIPLQTRNSPSRQHHHDFRIYYILSEKTHKSNKSLLTEFYGKFLPRHLGTFSCGVRTKKQYGQRRARAHAGSSRKSWMIGYLQREIVVAGCLTTRSR